MTTRGQGGEEWLAMDETTGYSAAAESETIYAARRRINEVRQRDARLRLVDRQGVPLSRTPVQVVQTSSPFVWGHNLWGLDTRVREGTQYRDDCQTEYRHLAQLVNAVNALHYWTERPRNDGPKSEEVLGYPTYDHLQWCVDWGNANGLTVKGHPLFWTVPKAVPDWVQNYSSYSTRMAFLEVRIRQIVSRFMGTIKIYDAVNEPMWEPSFKDLPQRTWPHMTAISDIADYIEPVLRWAREEDPDATYLINEYGVTLGDHSPCAVPGSDGSVVTPDSQFHRYLELLKELQSRGTAPDAVGLQGHTGGWGDHDKDVATYEKIMEETGLPVHITEFWAHANHLVEAGMSQADIRAAQLEYVSNCMTCAFGCPAVDAFFFWGMLKDLMNNSGKPGVEPNDLYWGIHRLIHETWRTREELTTDSDGYLQFRGFHGDYALRFPLASGQQQGQTFTLPVGSNLFEDQIAIVHRSALGKADA